ncbi:MAG: TolC family protein, partial [Planctomycetota bacterium]
NSIIVAELRVKDTQRTLKQIVNLPGVDVDSPAKLVLLSEPDPVRYELDARELIDASLDERVELLELELQLSQDLSTIDFRKNQRLPLFTLDYTYRIHGPGESPSDAFDALAGWDQWGWRLGVNAEIPIGNEAAEARVHRAILNRLQRLATRSVREQVVKQEVLNALDNLEATWRRILAAMQDEILQARNYQAERDQYRLGLRNSTDVLDAEDRLANAKIGAISATVDYQIAQIDLAFATGTLLGAARVSW